MTTDPGRETLDPGEIRRLRASYLRNDVRSMVEQRGAAGDCCCCGISSGTAAAMSQSVDDQARALIRYALAGVAVALDSSASERQAARVCADRLTAAVPGEDWLPGRRRVVRGVGGAQDRCVHPDVAACDALGCVFVVPADTPVPGGQLGPC
jgi:hypothetical protein